MQQPNSVREDDPIAASDHTPQDGLVIAETESSETRLMPVVQPPAPTPFAADINAPELFIHRELSQLQFNIRVLEQALDESYPLLERLKFLLIFSGNG